MDEVLAADVARVLTALHDAGAWFRTGLTDPRLAELTGLPMTRMLAASRAALTEGLVERRRVGSSEAVTLLTPIGVERIRPPRPVEEKKEESGAA
jgi:hypothetical protein